MRSARAEGLPAFAVFAGVLAAAGLPIYIHAPAVYAERHGVGLAALGGTLAALRLVDVVQDPALGWLAARLGRWRGTAVAVAGAAMAAAMLALFAVEPPVAPLLWFGGTLALLFTAFSFLTIAFYAEGVRTAGRLTGDGHVRVAAWRETGALLGVCLAAAAPTALGFTGRPYAAFAAGFAALAFVAVVAMRGRWSAAPAAPSGLRTVLADPVARRLLAVALLNAAPVAVTSTLFLFYVRDRLQAPGAEGPLLILFFLSAAAAAPLWARLATRIGPKRTLIAGMVLSMAAFAVTLTLGAGDTWAFAAVCAASGAALGADMTLLPALFARRMAAVAPDAAEGFGLWSLVSKATLALAAATVLPALGRAGYDPGAGTQDAAALAWLTALYAGLPVGLKAAALALLAGTDVGGDRSPDDERRRRA